MHSPGPGAGSATRAQVAGLVLTVASSRALDVLDLSGVRQVLNARAGGATAPHALETGGVYGLVRHPLYFGWALFVFGAPDMTLTRFSFAAISTAYLAVAIPFEERGLIRTFGSDYEAYRRRSGGACSRDVLTGALRARDSQVAAQRADCSCASTRVGIATRIAQRSCPVSSKKNG